jgi:hypothetical protein
MAVVIMHGALLKQQRPGCADIQSLARCFTWHGLPHKACLLNVAMCDALPREFVLAPRQTPSVPAALSAYMPLREKETIVSVANKATPILMCHGDADQVVRYLVVKTWVNVQEQGVA